MENGVACEREHVCLYPGRGKVEWRVRREEGGD
jgi:hypothetical protein